MAETTSRDVEPNESYFRMREEQQATQNNAANTKVYVSLMLTVGLAAIVSLIVSLVVLSNQGITTCVITGSGSGLSSPNTVDDARVWNLAIGHYDNNEAYIDQMTGQVKGFHVDIAYEVCKIANKNCRLQWDLYNRCWDSQVGESPRGGIGLMGGWYDGCVGWVQTYNRIRTFQFTNQWAKPITTYLVVKSNNPRGVNPVDLTGKTLGFVDGYFSDEFCLARQESITVIDRAVFFNTEPFSLGNGKWVDSPKTDLPMTSRTCSISPERRLLMGRAEKTKDTKDWLAIIGRNLPSSQVVHVASHRELFQAIDAGTIDAGFTTLLGGTVQQSLQILGDKKYNCMLPNGGTAIMTRLDNSLPDWWNPALNKLLASSSYKRICDDLKIAHGDVDGKDPSDICLGM